MVLQPVGEIIHLLELVDYLFVQADKPWYNYNLTGMNYLFALLDDVVDMGTTLAPLGANSFLQGLTSI